MLAAQLILLFPYVHYCMLVELFLYEFEFEFECVLVQKTRTIVCDICVCDRQSVCIYNSNFICQHNGQQVIMTNIIIRYSDFDNSNVAKWTTFHKY